MNVVSGFQQSMAVGDRVFTWWIRQARVATTFLDEGRIEFKDVSFEYTLVSTGVETLEFHVEPDKVCAFVGQARIQKIFYYELPSDSMTHLSGAILIDGKTRDFNNVVNSEIAARSYLFTGTIASNVGLNNESIQPETIKGKALKVGGGHLLKEWQRTNYEVKEKGMDFFRGTPTDFILPERLSLTRKS